jgi:rod shape-determining protein MreC
MFKQIKQSLAPIYEPILYLMNKGMLVIAVVFCILVAVLINRTDAQSDSLKDQLSDALHSIQKVAYAPFESLNAIPNFFSNIIVTKSYIAQMELENFALRKQIQELKLELTEFDRLKEQLRYYPSLEKAGITAKVVASKYDGKISYAIIDQGSDAGIKIGSPVINDLGLVGKIASLTSKSARIILLNDNSLHIPVISSHSKVNFVANGRSNVIGNLSARFGSDLHEIQENEIILTSGEGEIFPSGLLVGFSLKSGNSEPLIKIAVDFSKLEFVRILHADMKE